MDEEGSTIKIYYNDLTEKFLARKYKILIKDASYITSLLQNILVRFNYNYLSNLLWNMITNKI